jgi:hypothetical protein
MPVVDGLTYWETDRADRCIGELHMAGNVNRCDARTRWRCGNGCSEPVCRAHQRRHECREGRRLMQAVERFTIPTLINVVREVTTTSGTESPSTGTDNSSPSASRS